MKNDAIEQAERQLAAMDRDTLRACNIEDGIDGRHYGFEPTEDQRAEPMFCWVACAAAAHGRASIIQWLWDRYCDGRAVAQAREAIGSAAMKQANAARIARKAEDNRRRSSAKSLVPTPRRVGADLASEREELER